jgi:hypothetical protein
MTGIRKATHIEHLFVSRDIRRAFGLYEFWSQRSRGDNSGRRLFSASGKSFMQAKTTKTGTFMAVDKFGKTHTVSEWTNFQDASGHGDDAERWEPASKAFRLDNGDYVQVLDDDTLLVVRTGTRLRVARPAAPLQARGSVAAPMGSPARDR